MTDVPPTPSPVPSAPPAPPVPPPAPGPPPGVDPQLYTQQLQQLDAWARQWGTQQVQRGREQIEKEIAENLGCTVEEAQELIKKGREAQDANLSEADRKLRDAEKSKTDARKVLDQAHQLIYDTLVDDALVQQGMTREAARVARPLVRVQGDVTLESIVAAAAAVKVGFPQLFGTAPPPPAGQGGNGTPGQPPGPADRRPGGPVDTATRGTPPASTGQGETARDRAMARLRDRRGGRLRVDGPPPPEMDYRRSS